MIFSHLLTDLLLPHRKPTISLPTSLKPSETPNHKRTTTQHPFRSHSHIFRSHHHASKRLHFSQRLLPVFEASLAITSAGSLLPSQTSSLIMGNCLTTPGNGTSKPESLHAIGTIVPTTFHLFPRLPAELQLLICRFYIQDFVDSFAAPSFTDHHSLLYNVQRDFTGASLFFGHRCQNPDCQIVALPAALQVSRLARDAALDGLVGAEMWVAAQPFVGIRRVMVVDFRRWSGA